jgi:hypothetical protein
MWVAPDIHLDHKENRKPPTSFKFNHDWLVEEDFRQIISKNWKLYDPSSRESAMYKFASNIKQVKKLVAR